MGLKFFSMMRSTVVIGLMCGMWTVAGCGGSSTPEPAAAPPPKLAAPAPPPVPPATPSAAPETPTVDDNGEPVAPVPVVSTNPDAMLIVPEKLELSRPAKGPREEDKLLVVGDVPRPDQFQVVSAAPVTISLPAPLPSADGAQVPPAGGETSPTPTPPDAAPATTPLRLPPGFVPLMEFGTHTTGWPHRIRSERDGMIMALVPAGVFRQGTNDGPPETQPQHDHYLDAFYIDLFETRLKEYQAYREDARARKQKVPASPLNEGAPENYPVVGISWTDARNYARAIGKELPTEAEWEKAARGLQGSLFPWGNDRPAWAYAKETSTIRAVGSEPTDISVYGIYDMAGNAREWCHDLYAVDAYPELLKDTSDIPRNWPGPRNPTEKFQHVVKGNGPDWKLPHRAGVVMTDKPPGVGFRTVLRFHNIE